MTGGTLLHHVLDRAARQRPESPAFTCRGTCLTYGALHEASHRLAGWLSDRGLARGDRLVVAVAPDEHIPALLYAASRIGVVFVVVHDQTRSAVLDHVLTDCEPALVVADQPEWRSCATRLGIEVVDPGELATAGRHAPDTERRERLEPLAVDPACLIYTSGSTAMPKAVVSTHQQMVFAAEAIQSVLGYRGDDVVFSALPLSFDYGLYQLFIAALGTAHVWWATPGEAGPALLTSLRRARATVFPATPWLARTLARLLRRGHDDVQAEVTPLRLLTSTGAAMPPATVAVLRQRLPDLRVQLMFGLTECKRVAIMPPDGDVDRQDSSGLPLPGTEVIVVDERGAALPPGSVGEFVVRGPHVMSGYWRRPEATAERFRLRDGLFPQLHTGDYGWLDREGYLYFVGRRDDIYKSRGFRVSAVEVEAAACRVPGVRRAAVLPPGSGRTAPVLFVAAARTADVVLAGLRAELEEFKIPAECVVLDTLPENGNGKVDKVALAALAGREVADAR